MWQQVYDSGWHHPAACWLATGAAALAVWRTWRERAPSLRRWWWLFALGIAVDAAWTGAWSPVPSTHPIYQPMAILFVVLGDWRYFALGERELAGGGRGWWTGLGWTLVVPVLHGLAIRMWPAVFADSHVLFLVYELAQALVVGVWWLRRGVRLSGETRRWLGLVTAFELCQYLGWAAADVVIVQGHDVGYGLRMLPNLMYYAGFVAFAWWTAPRVRAPAVAA